MNGDIGLALRCAPVAEMDRVTMSRMMWIRGAILVVCAIFPLACDGRSENSREAQRAFWSQQVNRERVEKFVYANAIFTLFHELGHFIFDQYGVPIGGREEDAADRLAVVMMTPPAAAGNPEAESIASPAATDLVWVAHWWIEQGKLRPQERQSIPWYDEHGVDERRGYQVLCLLYGSNPARYDLVAREFGLPADQRKKCVPESARNQASWNALIGAHVADDAELAANRTRFAEWMGRGPERKPGSLAARILEDRSAKVPVPTFMRIFTYDPAPERVQGLSLEDAALVWDSKGFLQRREMLERVVDEMLSLKIPAGQSLPHVAARQCGGEANAAYTVDIDRAQRRQTVFICYPLVDRFASSARNLLWTLEQTKNSGGQ
jgi:hypothetical protein